MLRGGLVGLGNVARNGHLPAWLDRDDVEIVAGADVVSESRDAAAKVLPGLALHDSADALLERERLDFVDVCTPPASHAQLIRLSLERGLHVLCEKPLVLEGSQLSDLAALARRRNRVLAAVHNWRHAPALALASELVAAGRIGAVRRCDWEVLRDRPSVAASRPGVPNWRLDPEVSGGGILVDHGWHAAYVLAGWMSGPLTRAAGRLETRKHHEWPVEDTARVHLEFGDEQAAMFLTWAAAERKNRVVIEGTEGSISIENGNFEIQSREGTERREIGSLSEGSHHPEWFAGTAAEFVGEIADPAGRGRSLAESAICLQVIRLARESDRLDGAPVSAGGSSAPSWRADVAAREAAGRPS
jgi:predicted dehydrogenase